MSGGSCVGPSPTHHHQEPAYHPAVWKYSWFPRWHSQTARPPLLDPPLQLNIVTENVKILSTQVCAVVQTHRQKLMSYTDMPSVHRGLTRTPEYLDSVGSPLLRWSAPGSPCSPCPYLSGWTWPNRLPAFTKEKESCYQLLNMIDFSFMG